MARQATVDVAKGTWTQLTAADVAAITFQNIGSSYVLISGTNGATAPGSTDGALRYNPGQGEMNTSVADMFPGVSGVNRIWAYCVGTSQVSVSHA